MTSVRINSTQFTALKLMGCIPPQENYRTCTLDQDDFDALMRSIGRDPALAREQVAQIEAQERATLRANAAQRSSAERIAIAARKLIDACNGTAQRRVAWQTGIGEAASNLFELAQTHREGERQSVDALHEYIDTVAKSIKS